MKIKLTHRSVADTLSATLTQTLLGLSEKNSRKLVKHIDRASDKLAKKYAAILQKHEAKKQKDTKKKVSKTPAKQGKGVKVPVQFSLEKVG